MINLVHWDMIISADDNWSEWVGIMLMTIGDGQGDNDLRWKVLMIHDHNGFWQGLTIMLNIDYDNHHDYWSPRTYVKENGDW